MKRQTFIFLLITLFFSCQDLVYSQKIYLSPSGDDTNPGTIDKPLATLNRAVNNAGKLRISGQADGPVEIIVLQGNYFMLQPLAITANDSGTPGSPLIIRAEDGANPVFTAGIRVNGFEKISENLWRAYIPQVALYDSYFEQLYVNDRRAVRAQTPDEGFYFVRGVTETVLEKGEGRSPLFAVQKIRLDSMDAGCFRSFSEADFQDAIITFYHKWDNTRKRVASFNSAESSVYTVGTGMKPWNSLDNKTRYKVENFKAALNNPGEWFLDRSGYLYYIPLPGETPENSEVYAPVLKEFITITGESAGKNVSSIRFENLSFRVAGYRTPEANLPRLLLRSVQ